MERWFPIPTQRLLLREFTAADEPDMHEYASDPLVSKYESWGPNTREITHEVLSRRLGEQKQWPREDVHLAVELREERKLIGSIRLWVVDRVTSTAELGYTLNRAYWNKGYATEAARAVLERGFGMLNLHRICASCDTRNVASWRVMEKIGMRREGHFLQDKRQRGEWRDSYLYAVLPFETGV